MNDDANHNRPVDRALDVLVYAPLGLAALARDTLPGLLHAFAQRGRAELDNRRHTAEEKVGQARTVGRFAVDYGGPVVRRRVEQRLNDVRGKAEQTFSGLVARPDVTPPTLAEERVVASAPDVVDASRELPTTEEWFDEPVAPAVTAAPVAAAPSNGAGAFPAAGPVSGLPIPDYDELSASQVVQRLPGLGHDELEAIRAYEARGRGRRTILGKIDQLAR